MLLTIIYIQKKQPECEIKVLLPSFISFLFVTTAIRIVSLVQRVEADDPRNVRLSCDSLYQPTLFFVSLFPIFKLYSVFITKLLDIFVSFCPLKICA